MIGKKLRGHKHLLRTVKADGASMVLYSFPRHRYTLFGIAFIFGGELYIANREYATTEAISPKNNAFIKEFAEKHFQLNDVMLCNGEVRSIRLVGNDFIDKYDLFVRENKTMFSSFEKRFGADEYDSRFLGIFAITEGSKNFFQWAVNLIFNRDVSYDTIERIISWNEKYKGLSRDLTRGTITAYTTFPAVFELMKEMSLLRIGKRAKTAISLFNTAQKHLIRDNVGGHEDDKEVLAKFSILSETKKNNFVRKMSNVESYDEIMHQMRHLTGAHFAWNKDSFLDYIGHVEGINFEIVFESPNIVLGIAKDYETIKNVGKTTNWCISKNLSYWRNYVRDKRQNITQYVLFDFSKPEDDELSIVGFTCNERGSIIHAHNFTNGDINNADIGQIGHDDDVCYLTSQNSIYSVLDDCGISTSMLVPEHAIPYEWTFDGVMGFITTHCAKDSDVEVISHKDSKAVIKVHNGRMKSFFGGDYGKIMGIGISNNEHVLFCDFAKKNNDPKRCYFAIIVGREESSSEVSGVFNANAIGIGGWDEFNILLLEYGLTHEIIKRPKDDFACYSSAFSHCCTSLCRKFIGNKDVMSRLFKRVDAYELIARIQDLVLGKASFDFIRLLYDNGYTLSRIMSKAAIILVDRTLPRLCANADNASGAALKMDEDTVRKFYNRELKNPCDLIVVSCLEFLKLVAEHETFNDKAKESIRHSMVASRCLLKPVLADTLTRLFPFIKETAEKVETQVFSFDEFFSLFQDAETTRDIAR